MGSTGRGQDAGKVVRRRHGVKNKSRSKTMLSLEKGRSALGERGVGEYLRGWSGGAFERKKPQNSLINYTLRDQKREQ